MTRVFGLIRSRSSWIAYALSVVLVALTLGVGLLLMQLMHSQVPATIFVVPVVFAAWYGGLGPGLLATLLGVIVYNLYLLAPYGQISTHPDDLIRIAVLIFVAIVVNTLELARRRLEQQS